MIKFVAFDWNGTLLADAVSCLAGDNAVFESFGYKTITLKQFRDNFDVPIINFYTNIGHDPEIFQANFQRNESLFHDVYEKRAAKCRTRANTRTLLSWLEKQKITSIIFSNHTQTGIAKQLKRLKIENFFEIVIANEAIGLAFHGRSKGEKLKNYIKGQKIKPNEVVIIGDTSEEVEIGQQLGSITVAITNGYHSTSRLKAAKPDYLIHDLKEVINIIQNLNGK